MPDLNITAILAAIFGGSVVGGLVKLYDTYLSGHQQRHDQSIEQRAQEHTQAMDLVTTLRDDVEGLKDRQDHVEHELAESRQAKVILTAQVQLLIERIDVLLNRLDKYEDVSDAERMRYTEVPDVSSTAHTVNEA